MSKSRSIWYPENPGDYGRKTAHLSLAEHGAYLLLRHHYYSTGRALPANAAVLLRVCRAFADEEIAAVHAVVAEFFTIGPDGYHNKRCDEEIARRVEISEKRRGAAQIMLSRKVANAPANAPANAHTTTTTTTVREEDGGGSAPAREADTLQEDVLQAAGVDLTKCVTGKWYSSTTTHTISQWRALGLTDDEILSVVASVMRNRTGPPGSLSYFTAAMQRAAGMKNATPLAPMEPTNDRPRAGKIHEIIRRAAER